MTIQDYLVNPCKVSSLPYWKTATFTLPANMAVVHDDDFQEEAYTDYTDQRYFRVYHDLNNINQIALDDYEIVTATQNDINIIVSIINNSYENIQVDYEQMISYQSTAVYQPNLWLLVKDVLNNEFVACAIADYDSQVRELILEWIQVLPHYRGRKIGQFMVNALLLRMKDTARFATVSGSIDNKSNPLALYRKCGFVGNDVWHILRRFAIRR